MPFDRVLVDAPCSGLGVLGRRADARWRKGPAILARCRRSSSSCCRRRAPRATGGVLVYSVCSFEPEETTEVVETSSSSNPQFVLESPRVLLPTTWWTRTASCACFPTCIGCDGAFAARFRRT
jgi:16S rRNA (cytosine967-C5)-methyltransferase